MHGNFEILDSGVIRPNPTAGAYNISYSNHSLRNNTVYRYMAIEGIHLFLILNLKK